MVSFNLRISRISIYSQKQLKDIVHEHTIICRQLFAGRVVGSRPMRKEETFAWNDNMLYRP